MFLQVDEFYRVPNAQSYSKIVYIKNKTIQRRKNKILCGAKVFVYEMDDRYNSPDYKVIQKVF
jgi:hypothetical protein